MAVLVGIDEAGFGPILGPLVVSSSSFSIPRHHIKADLWQILKRSVSNRRKGLAGRLLIADSKKVYNKREGIKHLERTALVCLKCLGEKPTRLSELIKLLCPDSLGRLENYPWYRGVGNCDISVNKADMSIASSVLSDDFALNQIELLDIKSRCLDVAYYNKMVNSVRNKARVLFTATSQLIKRAWDNFAGDELQIIVDKQGGRVRYRRNLQQMFPGMELTIVRERPAVSSYELQDNGKVMRLHFVLGGDEKFLPVSLASMVSKYLRQLLVENINRYFVGFQTDLRPTAGYWKDGLRFIEDVKTHISHVHFDSNQLIRCR